MQYQRRLLLGLPLALCLAACSRKPRQTPLPAGAKVLAFGDSVTYGTGAAPGEDWPSRLAKLTGWQIENAGIPGDTAQAGKSRLPELLATHQPQLVIVEIGGNDFLRRRPAAEVKEDLRQILRTIQASGARLVLVAVPELSALGVLTGKPSDSPIYQALAEEEKQPLIEGVFSGILANPAWRADAVHPNAEGYRHMADGLHQQLKQLGFL